MKRIVQAFLLLALLTVSGCTIYDKLISHRLMQKRVLSHENRKSSWFFSDLNHDNTDEIILSSIESNNQSQLSIHDLEGKVLAMQNIPGKLLYGTVLKDPRDGRSWLLYSYNDSQRVFLKASTYEWTSPPRRTDISYEPLIRIPNPNDNVNVVYNGQIRPQFIEDIDRDGRQELICIGYGELKANPRGLIVYDLLTGGREWYYRSSFEINTLIYEDIDANGTKEFLISGNASFNSGEYFDDMDDQNGWLVLLDNRGRKLSSEKLFSGYGSAALATSDTNQDGLREIYCNINTWGSLDRQNRIEQFDLKNGRFIRKRQYELDLSTLNSDSQNWLFRLNRDGDMRILINDSSRGLIVLDERLEQHSTAEQRWIKRIYGAEDIDGDGNNELLILTENDDLEIWDNRLRRRAGMPNPFPGEKDISFSLLEQRDSKKKLIIVGSPLKLALFEYNRLPIYTVMLDLLRHYSLNLLVIAILVILILTYLIRLKQKNYRYALDQFFIGAILTSGTNRISYYNSHIQALLLQNQKRNQTLKLRYLSDIFPELAAAVQSFSLSGKPTVRLRLRLLYGKLDAEYNVAIFRWNAFPQRYLLFLIPEHVAPDGMEDKMIWADIARRLSHNVRRHITNVILALEPLEKNVQNVDDSSDYLDIIKYEIEQIRVFTHAFQRFTELKDYDTKLQDILPSIEHTLSRIKIPENVKLIKNWKLSSAEARIEPIRFEEALYNLFTNALEAMKQGGVLHITIKVFPSHMSPQEGMNTLLEIEDSGCGIPQSYIEDIWKPFFTTKQSGTGIGLPETYKIIQSMQGSISIQSEENVGTTVSIWLKGE